MSLQDPSIEQERNAPEEAAANAEQTSRLIAVYWQVHSKLKTWLGREFGGGPPYPEDVIQQTFAKLAARGDLEKVENLEAYAWTTAVNCVRHERRAKMVADAHAEDHRTAFWALERDEFDPERLLRAREELEIVAQTLQKMSERRRTIFMACRFEGLSQAEAGRRAGVTRTAAVRHIAIATDMILEALSACDESADETVER